MSPHTWWIDNSHKRFNAELSNSKEAQPAERYVYMSDENKVAIKAIGVCRLKLDSGFCF